VISSKLVSGTARDETLKDARITSASPTTREWRCSSAAAPESDSRRLDLVVIDRGQREDRDMFHCAAGPGPPVSGGPGYVFSFLSTMA
jgi:hypothetical protein